MIRTITRPSLQELLRDMQTVGLSIRDIDGFHDTASGHVTVMYEDNSPSEVIDVSAGEAGVAAATSVSSNVAFLTALRSSQTESFASDTFSLSDAYVIPRTVVLTDTGSSAPTLVDNGRGVLMTQKDHVHVGTINYASGAVVVTLGGRFAARAGSWSAAYSYSAAPDTDPVPNVAILDQLVIETATAGSISYELYEDSGLTGVPVASGSITTVATLANPARFVGRALLNCVSTQMDTDWTKRTGRWLRVSATPAFVRANLYWRRLGE
jgi:hypothetical protein